MKRSSSRRRFGAPPKSPRGSTELPDRQQQQQHDVRARREGKGEFHPPKGRSASEDSRARPAASQTSLTRVDSAPGPIPTSGKMPPSPPPPPPPQRLSGGSRRKSFNDDDGGGDIPEEVKAWKVLVAEDNAVNQMVITRMLKQMGVDCDVVDNGLKALDACKTTSYNLVLMVSHAADLSCLMCHAFRGLLGLRIVGL